MQLKIIPRNKLSHQGIYANFITHKKPRFPIRKTGSKKFGFDL
jgi:hypothetical protein